MAIDRYPKPVYSHDRVVREAHLFDTAIMQFHLTVYKKFRVPKMAGELVDLHKLYIETTSRGGIEKVISDKKWSDVVAEFDYSQKVTCASERLKRHYINQLYHFEKAYFFRVQGPLLPLSSLLERKKRQRRTNTLQLVVPNSEERNLPISRNAGPCEFNLAGQIEGRYNNGYLVSLNIGNKLLRGTLYEVMPPLPPPSRPSTGTGTSTAGTSTVRTKRKRGQKMREPVGTGTGTSKKGPKKYKTAYAIFSAEMVGRLKGTELTKQGGYGTIVHQAWYGLATEQRVVYYEKAQKDKERYEREMQEYSKRK